MARSPEILGDHLNQFSIGNPTQAFHSALIH